MKTRHHILPTLLLIFLLTNCTIMAQNTTIDQKVDSLLSLMTLEEKVGQMNQYSGFWDATGPVPKVGNAAIKYEHLKKGWVGSMLNVKGVETVRELQKLAVEESRTNPLGRGSQLGHGSHRKFG